MIWKVIVVAGLLVVAWVVCAIVIGVINDYQDMGRYLRGEDDE